MDENMMNIRFKCICFFILYTVFVSCYAVPPQPESLFETIDDYDLNGSVSELLLKSCAGEECTIMKYQSFDEFGRLIAHANVKDCDSFKACLKKSGHHVVFVEDDAGRVDTIVTNNSGYKMGKSTEVRVNKFDNLGRPVELQSITKTDERLLDDESMSGDEVIKSRGHINNITWMGDSYISEACFQTNEQCRKRLDKVFVQYDKGNLVNVYAMRKGQVLKIRQYKYDANNNMTEDTVYSYSNEAWGSNSSIRADSSKTLTLSYNEYNLIETSKSNSSESRYLDYTFDDCKNWVSREVIFKNNLQNFNLSTTEKRDIKYFDESM